MKTLLIYDNNGRIYYQASGDYTLPQGLQYLEVEVPEGKYIAGVDVQNKSAILEDLPVSQDQKNADDITNLQLAVAELAEQLAGGVSNG